MFFAGKGSGEGLPYLEEFLLCEHLHWSWQELRRTPRPIVELWSLYRNSRAAAEGWGREPA